VSYNIPLFKLNYDEEEENAILETIRSKWISIGAKTTELEELTCSMFNVRYSIGLANCTVALHLALRLLNIGENDEVILPSLTFVATANAVRYVNATPVFCDIKGLDDLTIDPDKIEKLITGKTKAIIVMHYAGFPCDMKRIMEIAEKYNLKVVEDACHGPLSEYDGMKLGTIGDIGCFSFFSNKNVSTGEGGLLVTNNPELAERAKLLRSHGMTTMSYERAKGHSTSYDVIDLGYNYRIDDIHSSLAVVQFKKLQGDLKKRESVREHYLKRLNSIDNLVIPFGDNKRFVSNYIFPVVVKNSTAEKRDAIRTELQKKGIQTSVHYPAVHRFSIYSAYSKSLPLTEYVTDNEITLPMYASLTENEIDYIADSLIKAL